jgi:uncharacterized membrane protein
MDSQKRTITKTISFRILATLSTMILVYIVTGELALAGIIGGADAVIKTILYYFHERAWNLTDWGKSHEPIRRKR